jgi:hypothetical protein
MALRKPIIPQGPGGVIQQPAEEWAAEYPHVWEFISLDKWEDGSPRIPGSITLFAEDGAWKACLNDKGMQLVAFVTARSAEGLFEAMQGALMTGLADWRKSKAPHQRGKAR